MILTKPYARRTVIVLGHPPAQCRTSQAERPPAKRLRLKAGLTVLVHLLGVWHMGVSCVEDPLKNVLFLVVSPKTSKNGYPQKRPTYVRPCWKSQADSEDTWVLGFRFLGSLVSLRQGAGPSH